MTTGEAACREKYIYYTGSKTEVRIANKPEVQLHMMDTKLFADINLLMTSPMSTL